MPELDGPPRAFLSYARSDGENFARELRERLEAEEPEITLWQDRTDMAPAAWWRQITEALDRVPFMILVLTPAAVGSPVVWREWRYARQQGVCVVLVKGDPALSFASLPRWMAREHCYDISREWQTFVRALKSPPRSVRVPFMAPELPEGYIERPREFDQLRARLLDPDHHAPVAITTALRGPGGLGKTTLAAALCHDDEVQAAFHDGILWVTLGQEPNLLDALTKLYAALAGDRPAFRDVEDAAAHLATKLEDRTCLVVLDDVWDPAHLRPFHRGTKGEGSCGWLITTRQLEVAVDAQRVEIDTMTPGESVEMLAGRLDPPPADLAPFRTLAHRLGDWPLRLELASAALRLRLARGDSLDGALGYLNLALDRKGVGAFDRNAAERQQSMVRTIEVGAELLATDDRLRFRELAIFPEDIDVPRTAVSALWGLDAFDAEDAIQRLGDLALLKFDLQAGIVRLHDVMRSYLVEQLKLHSIDLAPLHARLVDGWGDPHRLPDAYAWRWLAYHLVEAGRRDQLRTLLLDPVWLQAKLDSTDANALLANFDRASDETDLHLVGDAIRLSAHILAQDKRQLPGQMLGRLLGFEVPAIQDLLARFGKASVGPCLLPLTASLTPPGGALLRTLAGHSGSVNAVAVTPDGRRAVSASDDNTLKVWDLESGAEVRTLAGHSDSVNAAAVTPDGRRAVSASDDDTLKVWDLESGAEIRALVGHSDSVNAVEVTPDGRRAVSASRDKTLKVWDLKSGAEVRTLAGHSGSVNAVAVAPDGQRAVSASSDNTLKVWDLESGAEVRTLVGDSDSVNDVAVTSDGRRAVSASRGKMLKVWDLESGAEIRTLVGHSSSVNAVAVTPDGRRAVSASDDNTLKVWDLESGAEVRTLAWHSDWVNDVAVTPDRRRAVSASVDKTLKVWDLESGAEVRTLVGHSSSVNAVAVTPDGRRAVSASDDNTLKVWDLESGAEVRTLAWHSDWVNDVAVTPDRRRAVSASLDKTLKVWDLESGAEVRTLVGHSDSVNAVAVTPDGRRVVSASDDNTLKVWELESGAEVRTLAGHSDWVNAVAVTPDGRRAVSASRDKTLKVWDLESGAEVRTLAGHSNSVYAVAVTPDGRRAVSASRDKMLKVWDLESGAVVRTLAGHSNLVYGVAVTPDGRRAVSASFDNTLKVWDLESGAKVRTLAGHSSSVNAVAVTPDGRRAVSASFDNTLKVWDLDSGRILCGFSGDAGFLSLAIGPDGSTIVAGDGLGRVHILRLDLETGSG